MPYIQAIFSDPWALATLFLVLLGLLIAALGRPKNPISRKHAICALWAVCFGILATWGMRQERLVIAGGLAPSKDQPVAVPVEGTTRYVAPVLAYRHDSSMWLLLICGLGFVAAYKLARVGDEA
jgi:hypothetical protein